MNGLDKVLIDTSVWIEFFRKRQPYYSITLKLLSEDKVCCAGIILAELMQGAKTEKELKVIKEFISVFEFLEETPAIWEKSGSLSFILRQIGKASGLSDCHIAVLAAENNASLFTLDKHFDFIKDSVAISLYAYE
jgi:predicted nucleic acid-binding protein